MSLRESLLAVRPSEIVEVAGLKVEVRSLSLGERNTLAESCAKPDGSMDPQRFGSALIAATAFDPITGERLFGDDSDAVNSCALAVTEALMDAAMRVSGLAKGAVDAGKGVSSSTLSTDTSSN